MRGSIPERGVAGPGGVERDVDGLIDVQYIRYLLGFVLRAVWRHRVAAAATLLAVLAFTVAAFVLMPRQYLTHTRLFAQRNFVMPALGNPRRTVPAESDAPTRMASEAVMKRENLVSIIKETNLLDVWRSTRPPVLRLKDHVVDLIAGEQSDDEKIDALVGTMERRMWVTADEGTVTIGVLWPDAATAYRIIDVAQRNFIEERHTSEVATIQESITILERQAQTVHEEIQAGYEELRREAPAPTAAAASRPVRSAAREARIAELQSSLTAKRLAIADLEAYARRRLAELQSRLAEQRNTFGPRHPALANTERSIEELSTDSPQLAELRREEREIVAEMRSRGVSADAPAVQPGASGGFDQSLARAAIASIAQARDDSLRAERVSYRRTRLQMAENEYEDLMQRLQGARIELETARAAFKYRYGVITPPQVPKRAVRPNVVVFLAGGAVLSVFMAVFAAVALDVAGGRVVESWQVERMLGVRVLREVGQS